MIQKKRIYETAEPEDGYRVLVDRLWPRGVSKARAQLDAWDREIAPSDELRHWYDHDPQKWDEFQTRYEQELQTRVARAKLDQLAKLGCDGTVTLLYAARAGEISNAAVLQRILTDWKTPVSSN